MNRPDSQQQLQMKYRQIPVLPSAHLTSQHCQVRQFSVYAQQHVPCFVPQPPPWQEQLGKPPPPVGGAQSALAACTEGIGWPTSWRRAGKCV